MIRVFGATDKTFISNGDMVICPLKAKLHKVDNGDFYLDLETSLDYLDNIIAGNIVVVDTPQGAQAFRITNPTKTKNKITARAYHVFYDSKNYLIEDSNVVNKDCNDALDHLNSATEPDSPFTTISDVATVDSYRCVRESLYNAVLTVVERWGGHLVRDNFNIGIRTAIGADNGVTVQYAKNLKDITYEENDDNLVTQLLPVGQDGLMLNAVEPDADIYVYSDIQYDIPYTKTVSFEQNLNSEDFADDAAYTAALVDDLLAQAQAYVNANSIPQVNYTLKANLEKITDIGDTVQVIDSRLGVNILTNVISYDYDCILGKYTEIEFGNFKQTISGLASNITATINTTVNDKVTNVQAVLSQELQDATEQIIGSIGDSFVIYDGNQILVVDRLPKESAVNVMRINSGGIGFSQTGINGTFNSAWTIDGTLNMQAINVINLTASLIKGGTLKIGTQANTSGVIEVFDNENNLICQLDDNGIRTYANDGSYILMNGEIGFAGYDKNDTLLFWVNGDEFHMRKSVVEEEITLCGKVRFIPITTANNDGIGLVSSATGATRWL